MAFENQPQTLLVCGFFVFYMDFSLLFALWASVCLSLSLIWYIWYLQKSSQEQLDRYMAQFHQQLQIAQDERKELYDRIQAGTLPQYKEYAPEPNELDETTEETTDLEDAREDIQGVEE